MKFCYPFVIAFFVGLALETVAGDDSTRRRNAKPQPESTQVLEPPALSTGPATAGCRVAVHAPEFADTNIVHHVYLPDNWNQNGPPLPIIFEYTGNRHPPTGSTGDPKDAVLGYGISGGRFIWVTLPYVDESGKRNAPNWWGDIDATVHYAKVNVPRIIRRFNADPDAVFLCGFSRGAIGVSLIGLHDDEIASHWTAFVTHDHFDGVRQWRSTDWGSPLDDYREQAIRRIKRAGNRPWLVSQNGNIDPTKDFLRASLSHTEHFTFLPVNTREALGEFPNALAKAAHTDAWLLKPSRYRTSAWNWVNDVLSPAD
ncbi:hypothetical protein [Crateriforma conspicua]|uniref:Alpha/beta hydrolase family protein n=1 Tax=Crateriforma conspicua TaxID=2527996 RepID=A0A5C5XYL4_9PLAN|nr:hypothetical protein [Crateriforma conspicua]TWT68477.1 hypothetical protein Pan14r_07220 [Crateriforma conspicua]